MWSLRLALILHLWLQKGHWNCGSLLPHSNFRWHHELFAEAKVFPQPVQVNPAEMAVRLLLVGPRAVDCLDHEEAIPQQQNIHLSVSLTIFRGCI